jgi:hypothetical protein
MVQPFEFLKIHPYGSVLFDNQSGNKIEWKKENGGQMALNHSISGTVIKEHRAFLNSIFVRFIQSRFQVIWYSNTLSILK